MANILIVYSTTDGHTKRICERIKRVVEKEDHKVVLAVIDGEPEFDLGSIDKIVIGASVRYGKHRPVVYNFIGNNQAKLESMPNAFFSVNVVARKPEKNQPESNCKPPLISSTLD